MKGQNEPRTRRCTVSRGQMRELCVSTQLVLSRSTIALSPKRGCFPRTIWETFARQGARQGAHGARRLLVKVRTVHGGCSSRCARCTAVARQGAHGARWLLVKVRTMYGGAGPTYTATPEGACAGRAAYLCAAIRCWTRTHYFCSWKSHERDNFSF